VDDRTDDDERPRRQLHAIAERRGGHEPRDVAEGEERDDEGGGDECAATQVPVDEPKRQQQGGSGKHAPGERRRGVDEEHLAQVRLVQEQDGVGREQDRVQRQARERGREHVSRTRGRTWTFRPEPSALPGCGPRSAA
jgi:hypothetical protein